MFSPNDMNISDDVRIAVQPSTGDVLGNQASRAGAGPAVWAGGFCCHSCTGDG